MIDFELDRRVIDLRDRGRAFVADEVIPAEPREVSEHGLDGALRAELQEAARRVPAPGAGSDPSMLMTEAERL
jgi:hypothetical protein